MHWSAAPSDVKPSATLMKLALFFLLSFVGAGFAAETLPPNMAVDHFTLILQQRFAEELSYFVLDGERLGLRIESQGRAPGLLTIREHSSARVPIGTQNQPMFNFPVGYQF